MSYLQMETLTASQVDGIFEWLNRWEALQHTAIPIRFTEEFSNHLNYNNQKQNTYFKWEIIGETFKLDITDDQKFILEKMSNVKKGKDFNPIYVINEIEFKIIPKK